MLQYKELVICYTVMCFNCSSTFKKQKNKVNVNDFLEKLMSDPGPQCLMWLPILHRMATVENGTCH